MNKLYIAGLLLLTGTPVQAMEKVQQVLFPSQVTEKFFKAIEDADLATIKTMLQAGTSSNSLNAKRESALEVAVKKGYTGVVRLLLENGANPNYRDIYHETILTIAAAACYDEPTIARILLEGGADRTIGNDRQLPVEIAYANHNVRIAKFLEQGCTPEAIASWKAQYDKQMQEECGYSGQYL